MLSDDNHPGILTFLIGLIIVVMVGVWLSMMADQRLGFSKSFSRLKNEIELSATELEQLRNHHRDMSLRLAAVEPKGRMVSEARQSLLRQLRNLDQRRRILVASREELQSSIQTTEEGFSRYRAKYREMIWAEAKGQPMGNLVTRAGREYRQAVIARVTEVGLEIHHEHGLARVQAPDLDSALQERFQWNDEERRAQLQHELAQDASMTRGPDSGEMTLPTPGESIRFGADRVDPDAGELALLRGKVRAWKSRVAQLQSERNEARLAASSGARSSIPGTLETWQARATRLGNELTMARSELALAKAFLAALEPGDPLLTPDENLR